MTTPDEAYLLTYAHQQQAGSSPGKWDNCPTCEGHPWHGMGCRQYVPGVGVTIVPCPCPSSFEAAS